MKSLIFTVSVLLTGCSWIFVEDAAPLEPFPELLVAPLQCSSSRDTPAGDATLAAVYGAISVGGYGFAGVALQEGWDEDGGQLWGVLALTGATLFAALTAVHGASAHYGFTSASRCKKARTYYRYRGATP